MTSYKVLARKYRPKFFDDLIGQDILVKTIKNAILQDRVPHAILLHGVRGIGKTTTARIIAKVLNCTGRSSDNLSPCESCNHCIAIDKDNHLDVIEMDAASKTGVDDIRSIIETSYYKPSSAKYKIHIIDEIHMLSRQAFNALLKILEEPPEHTKFIFATTECEKIPATVLSRCIRFDLQRLSNQDIQKVLINICKKEAIEIDQESLTLIAQVADGSARDSLSLLEQAKNLTNDSSIKIADVQGMLGYSSKAQIITLLENIIAGNTKEALSLVSKSYKKGTIPTNILKNLLNIIHEIMHRKTTENHSEQSVFSKEENEKLDILTGQLSVSVLTRLWQVISQGIVEVKNAYSMWQAVDMIIMRICYLSDLPTANEIISKIHNIDIGKETIEKKNFTENIVSKKIESFTDILLLLDNNKDIILKYELENNAVVKSFDANKKSIVLSSKSELNAGFLQNLRQTVQELTGEKWQIVLQKENQDQLKTVRETKELKKKELIESAKQTKLVKRALALFPKSEIIDVTLLEN